MGVCIVERGFVWAAGLEPQICFASLQGALLCAGAGAAGAATTGADNVRIAAGLRSCGGGLRSDGCGGGGFGDVSVDASRSRTTEMMR